MRHPNAGIPDRSTSNPAGSSTVEGHFVTRVRSAVAENPQKTAYRFLADGERETDTLTYAELDASARSVAVSLHERCAPGDRVVLVCAPGLEFAVAFLGTLYAGCTAVPVAPPGITVATRAGLAAIVRDADPALIVRHGVDRLDPVEDLAPTAGYEELLRGDPDNWTAPAPDPQELAFLQYTSGSTGTPKGVMVTHGNLLANQAQIGRVFDGRPDDVIVSWLPVHHDMGLVGGLLHALYLGACAVLMPPTAFLRDPRRWPRAISAHRGTISPGPDFAYALCADAHADRGTGAGDDLDLRSWRIACNGSEPVRGETLRRFTETFAPHGFDQRAFCPSYGMAEATLLISGDGRREAPRTALFGPRGDEIVSCGPWQTEHLAVVRDGSPVEDGEEGEICVAGSNITPGYWRAAHATDSSRAVRDSELVLEGRRYLRTGDLGRIRDGHIYVTGRAKDLVVVRGRNHYPADIEATVQAVDRRLVAGGGAVFDTPRGPVAVQGVRGTDAALPALEQAARAAVAGVHGVVLADLVLVPPAAVPRTTSGKVRRSACRDAYLDGSLPRRTTGTGAPGAGPDHPLARTVADVFDVPGGTLPGDVPLTALGLDSLRAIQLVQRLHETFAWDVSQAELLTGVTLDALAADLAEHRAEPATTPAPGPGRELPSVPRGSLSYGQQALAFLTASSPDGPRDYTIARAFTLPAATDTEALTEALRGCAARHEQLRSRFPRSGEGFRHEVLDPMAHPWCHVESFPDPDALRERAAALLEDPVDIETGPLLDAVVLSAPTGPAVLVVRVSHLVADLHALAVLAREWASAYEAIRRGSSPRLPEPAPWHPVLERERTHVDDPEVQKAAQAWASRLEDLAPLDWPARPGGAGPRTGGDSVTMELDERTTARVMAVAAAASTTPFAVLLGCLGLFVAELTGRRELAIGVPLAVRDAAGAHDVVGYLVNTLPLPLSVPVGTAPGQAAALAARALADGMRHARIPLSTITGRIQRPRSAPGAPFSVMCDWVDDPAAGTRGFGAAALDLPHDGVTVGGLRLDPWQAGPPRPHADLDVAFTRAGRRVAGRFAFDRAAIDGASGRVLAGCFTDFVRRAMAAPDAPCSLTSSAAPASVLLPEADPEPPVTLGALFRHQVEQRPDAPALSAPDTRWSYAELASRVDALASALPSLDGPAPLVGLHLADVVDFVVAALAALVRGYGIVPLPPDAPGRRLAFMAEDCGIGAVVHDASATEATAWGARAISVPMPRDDVLTALSAAARGAGTPRTWSGGASTPDSAAYVVYTSGTTGRPKGVVIRHREVHPLLVWQADGLDAAPGMRLAQTLALSFDFGLQEIFTPLLYGGTLCVPAPAERHSAERYGSFLRRDGVNTLFATPTFLREMVAEQVDLTGLRLLVLGGEMLTPAAVRAALPLLAPDCRIINGYGPTEASINCTMHTVDRAALGSLTTLPVGAATGSSRVYVMGPGGRPLPEGIVGEVCVGGPGVARGYLNRPAETARAFVPDPVAADGTSMYRTGDLGYLRDGELTLVGRGDAQVKVRGYRVEPGEVEAALRALPGVRDAAVLADRSGTSVRLVAFVVRGRTGTEATGPTGGGDEAAEVSLRAALADSLPPYLLPQRIRTVETFPLTRHGKLDHAALLARVPRVTASGVPAAGAPEVITAVTAVWRDVLGLDALDIDTNFFEAGGHSLAVGSLVSRLADRLRLDDLPFHVVFEYPTVRLMAQHLERLLAERPVTGSPPGTPPQGRPLGGQPRRVRARQRALSHRKQSDPRSPQ